MQVSDYQGIRYEFAYRENRDGIFEVFHVKIPVGEQWIDQIEGWKKECMKWGIKYEFCC